MSDSTSSLVAAAFAILIAAAPLARAEGALAVGIQNNDASHGMAYGLSYDYATEGDAKYEALVICLGQPNSPEVLATCKILTTFRNQCMSVALDKKDGTPGWGWALGADKAAADRAARDKCRAIAGPGRADYCEIATSVCDAPTARVAEGPSTQLKTPIATKPQAVGGTKRQNR